MAELLIYNMDHWMDTYADRDAIEAAFPDNKHIGDKYDSRHHKGDVVEVQESGFWIGRCAGWGYPKFVILVVQDKTKAQALNYMDSWQRDVSVSRITNDTINHIYEYRVTVERLSLTHDDELFSEAKDKLTSLPSDCSIVSRSPSEVVLRLEPLTWPAVIAGDITPEERKQHVEEAGKELISDFTKLLRRRRIYLDMDTIPAGVQTALDTQHYYSTIWANVKPYVKDKVD